jgi:hypothetical protein
MSDELDRIISREDEIVPSSGFVASVMDAVRQEAAASQPIPFPPIPFPWVRALPGFIALGAVLALLIAGMVREARLPAVAYSHTLPDWLDSWTHSLVQANAEWIALALLLTAFSVFLILRLTKEPS